MSITALTHEISPDIATGERTWVDRDSIDLARADQQHLEYRHALEALGVTVVNLNVNRDFPDSVFMEDPVVIVDEVAILTRMGAESRRSEVEALSSVIGEYRPIFRMEAPATMDGGDVMLVDRRVYVGQSTRTNRAGFESLRDMLAPYDYNVIPVDVKKGCLHLITGATPLDHDTILVAKNTIDETPFHDFRLIHSPEGEEWAANIMAIGGEVILSSGYPKTADLLTNLGYTLRIVDNSELEKAEGSLTCLSVLFNT